MTPRALRIGVALAVVAAAIGISVPAASAGLLSCSANARPFTTWGDYDGYCAFPNLGFESGTTGWTLTGSTSLVADNEPWYVSGYGTHALNLAPGASAMTPRLSIGLLDLWMRFFAKSEGANGSLRVQVVLRGLTGNLLGLLNFDNLSPSGYSSWQPTQRVASLLALPLLTTSAQVLVTNTSSSGSWRVDDFYLDPCVSRVG